jgi:hypothetical protein
MTGALHATLAAGRWHQMTLVQQLANIGSEVGRAARAKSARVTSRGSGQLSNEASSRST